MDIRSLSPVVGAEITGVDLRQPLSAADRASVLDAFARYHLLLFRDQEIAPEQQTRFAEYFAPTVLTHQVRPEDGLMFISNRERGGAVGDGTLPFHSDHTFFKEPDTSALALYAIAVPSTGGDTVFANAAKAYDDLPATLKERIVGLQALHTYKRANQEAGAGFAAMQPLARTLADLGRNVLFVNQFCKHGVDGLADAESEELMAELFRYLYRDEFLYQHKWRAGDIVIWDNRVLQHARTDFNPSEPRTLRRSTQGVPEVVVEARPAVRA